MTTLCHLLCKIVVATPSGPALAFETTIVFQTGKWEVITVVVGGLEEMAP